MKSKLVAGLAAALLSVSGIAAATAADAEPQLEMKYEWIKHGTTFYVSPSHSRMDGIKAVRENPQYVKTFKCKATGGRVYLYLYQAVQGVF